MKKRTSRKLLSLAVAFALALGMTVTGHAAETALTRGEMAELLVKSAGLSDQAASYASQPSAFQDVAEGSRYEGYINLAYAKGLVSGTGNGTFSPDAKATQAEAAAMVLKASGVPAGLMTEWPADYSEMAEWSGLLDGVDYAADKAMTASAFDQMLANGAALVGRPVIGISWDSSTPLEDDKYFRASIKEAGGIPVDLDQVTSTAVAYDTDGMIEDAYVTETGNLKQEYADIIKSKDFTKSNVAEVMADIDGVFFIGGEDISPSLFAVPQAEANNGEEINATRDISDYTLMAYCIEEDIPTLAACRGEQMMSIVSGSTFIQDIPNYYAARNAVGTDIHRRSDGADFARHDVDIAKSESKWMYDIVGSTTLANVPSWHHQVVDSVEGTNLTVVATSTYNGITTVEAVERQDKTFCLGVQFHPEYDCGAVLCDNDTSEYLCDYGTCLRFFRTLVAYAADKPVIGISWKSPSQNYEGFKEVIRQAGGIPVEMPQVTSTAVGYDENGKIEDAYLEASGMLKQECADVIKSKDFSKSNAAAAVDFKDIDGMFFTGGEDVSPSLFAVPQAEANHGEEINTTRDISDYNLMAYCIEKDIPTFAVCRGEQVMGIVSGCDFIQDIPDYYASQDAAYADTHRMPPDAPNRTYARHDVDILDNSKWLENVVGGKALANVSSWHHQAVGSVEGTDLTVVAKSTYDGVEIVEAIERQDKTFCLGVQFHPENDCKLALYDGKEAICDLDTCMNFFRTLVSYAGK